MENNNKVKVKLKIREALAFGWNKTRERFWFFVGAGFIVTFIPTLITLPIDIMKSLGMLEGDLGQIFTGLNMIIYGLLIIAFYAGFLTILLKTLREEKASFQDFLIEGKCFLRLLAGYFLYTIAVTIGFLFFIIPGIFLATRLHFFDFLIIDKRMGPIEALKASYIMTKGYGWKIFLLVFIVSPLILLFGVLVFLVGILVAIPVVYLAHTLFYGKLLDKEIKEIPVQAS